MSQLPFSVQVVPNTQEGGTHTHRSHSWYRGGDITNQAHGRDAKNPLSQRTGVLRGFPQTCGEDGGGKGGGGDSGQKDDVHKIVIGDNVSAPSRKHLHAVHDKHSRVFDGDMKQGYNGHSGNFDVDFEWINGIPPPPHKGAVPNYCNHQDMQVLQSKIDYLEKQGIVKKI